MGEESKVRVNKSNTNRQVRHTGFKAVSTGQGSQQAKPTDQTPSPLTAEYQSLSQCLTLGAEGEQAKPTAKIPLSLDDRVPKPVPVPDTGSRGRQQDNPNRQNPPLP